MTGLLLALLAAVLLFLSSLTSPSVEDLHGGAVGILHESSDVLDLGVRMVSPTDRGPTVLVRVELSNHPEVDETAARMSAAILHGQGFDEAFVVGSIRVQTSLRGTGRGEFRVDIIALPGPWKLEKSD